MAHEVDYDLRLKAARLAVYEACEVCRAVQRDLDDVRLMTKDDRSPVTVADFASQAVVAHRLRETLGGAPHIVAEEDSKALRRDDHAAHLKKVVEAVRLVWPDATEADVIEAIDLGGDSGERSIFWTLDPIDGTKGFLRGEQYAISLAWIEAGAPTLAVLGCPNLSSDFARPFDDPDPNGTIYYAYTGTGLWEASADSPEADGVHQRRLTQEEGQPVRVVESVVKDHSAQSDTERVLESLGLPHETLRLDSQAKYAVVARGQADAYLRMPTKKGYVEKIWDHAAGSLLATEAGCAVTDIKGALLDFDQGRQLESNRGIACAPARLHGRLIGAIESLGLDSGA